MDVDYDPNAGAARPSLMVALTGIAMLVASAGCSTGAGSSGSTIAAPPSAQATVEPSSEELGARPLPDGNVPLEPGTWISRLGAPYPDILLDIPDGWHSLGGAWVTNQEDWPQLMGLTVWVVGDVYADPCQWDQPLITPGPTARELADVLATRPMRDATDPVDVEIDGHEGLYMRWHVPEDIDFSGCDVDPNDGEHYFESWKGIAGGSDRYQQGPGQVDELWIIDVGEHRIVFDVTHEPGSADTGALDELREMVETARFVDAEDGR